MRSSSTPITRRSILGGMAAATVIGWSTSHQAWARESDSFAHTAASLPALDGTLETSAGVKSTFNHDFGHMVTGACWAVLRPGSVQDIVKMVNYARANGLKIAMNGRGGQNGDEESHSCYGQAQVPQGGIAIDARGLTKIVRIGSSSAVVETGVTWAQLTDAALARGLTPPALTDYLHLSIGGTLSVGGIGSTVARYGLQIDTVKSIDIVTGNGDLITASPSCHADLFNTALGGGGQVGIIVRAEVALIPAPPKMTVFTLYYNDVSAFLADSEKLMAEKRFEGQVGEIARTPDDSGWWYKLEGQAYWKGSTAPNRTALLTGLHDVRASATIEDLPFREAVFRTDGDEAWLKENDFWGQPKPWLSLFVPASKAKAMADLLTAELNSDDLGAGFLLYYPYPTSKLTRPLSVQPSEPTAYLCDVLRFPAPGADIARMLDQNRRLYDKAVALGAKRYLVGAIPNMTSADWRAHFGIRWKVLVAAKRRYDPAGILTPGQGFFG
ncbi:FAD-binding protein [Streptomyces sp. NPDC048567]|uniref:FAD-binding protein n=1 Tax=unclassified Streptomyces TaxID=2593676 RepID=UPI002E81DFB8|nr:FAD-binding protein [Streptomyces sp. NBC_00523]WUD04648.1 FAD-binding protein [Streptomyces sp. NBC_00523]